MLGNKWGRFLGRQITHSSVSIISSKRSFLICPVYRGFIRQWVCRRALLPEAGRAAFQCCLFIPFPWRPKRGNALWEWLLIWHRCVKERSVRDGQMLECLQSKRHNDDAVRRAMLCCPPLSGASDSSACLKPTWIKKQPSGGFDWQTGGCRRRLRVILFNACVYFM